MVARPAAPRLVTSVRELAKEDLVRLSEPRRGITIKRIRDSHHYMARLFAYGFDIREVAERMGYTYERVRRVRSTPSFGQLVEDLRPTVLGKRVEDLDVFKDVATANMIRTEFMIADRLAEAEDSGDLIPIRELVAISADRADRFGYPKRQVNTNLNVDFADRLQNAIRRSAKAPALKVIEGSAVAPSQFPPERLSAGAESESSADSAPTFRRRL